MLGNGKLRAREALRGGAQAPPGAASLREIVMGAQDNLTNVLAVVLGVAIGSGDVATVALAGLASGMAEAISMAGVLYTATRAERDLGERSGEPRGAVKEPLGAAVVTFGAAIAAALIPLAPFAVLSLGPAMITSPAVSVVALFALGGWTGRVTGQPWRRAGLRFVVIGGLAAAGAALVGVALRTNGI